MADDEIDSANLARRRQYLGLVTMRMELAFAVSGPYFIIVVFIAVRHEETSYSTYKSNSTGVVTPTCFVKPFNTSIGDEVAHT